VVFEPFAVESPTFQPPQVAGIEPKDDALYVSADEVSFVL
jgi:hypothetical protein